MSRCRRNPCGWSASPVSSEFRRARLLNFAKRFITSRIGNCDGSASQSWTINRGSTIIQVKGTNYCFDSGDSPSNGALAKIWTVSFLSFLPARLRLYSPLRPPRSKCYQGIPAQTWWLTDAGDDHIALQDSGLCLDLPDGDKTVGKRLQLWECAGQNNNQKWTLS
jgi:hypothetical protein